MIKRLNLPLKRLDATETRLRTVSNDCFLWTGPFRERPERTELRLDDLILAGRERGRRTPFTSYSDNRSLVFIKIISAADDDVTPRSGEELEFVRFPIGSGAGAECWEYRVAVCVNSKELDALDRLSGWFPLRLDLYIAH